MRLLLVSLLGLVVVALGGSSALLMAMSAPSLEAPRETSWVLRDVTLVEPGRAPRPGSTLRVVDGRIDAIERTSGSDRLGAANEFGGLYVSPGLSDLHVHYPPKIAIGNAELWSLLLLAHGVTSIRETGSIDGSIFDVREAIRAGRYPGPRIFACGAILDGERPSFPSNRVVTGAASARAAVSELAAKGADCIKAYNMLSAEALAAIRRAAAEVGLPLIGHAPHSVGFEEAGLVDLQHGTGAVVVDRERIGRSDFLAADWATVDEERIEYVARVSLEHGIAHTPTLVNARMRRLLTDAEHARESVARDSGLRHLPSYWPAVWSMIWSAPFELGDAASEATHERFRARQAELTAALHRAGVRIHAGTDTLMPFVAPGSSLHGELADLVAAGIASQDVWAIATRGAGRGLRVSGLGTLDVGAPADLVLLRADPSDGLAALREIEAVVAAGRLYRRADLDAMLSAADAHFLGALYSGVMDALISLVQGRFAPEDT